MGTSLRRNWERRAVADSDIYCTNANTSSSASEPHEVQKIVSSELELPVRIGSVLKMFTWRTRDCRRKREVSETFVLNLHGDHWHAYQPRFAYNGPPHAHPDSQAAADLYIYRHTTIIHSTLF